MVEGAKLKNLVEMMEEEEEFAVEVTIGRKINKKNMRKKRMI